MTRRADLRKTIADLDNKMQSMDIHDISAQLRELRDQLKDRDSEKIVATEPAPVDLSYRRQRAVDFAIQIKPSPHELIPLAKKIEEYIYEAPAPVDGSKLGARLEGYSRGFKHGEMEALLDLLHDYEHLSDSMTVTVGDVRQVLRKRAGL